MKRREIVRQDRAATASNLCKKFDLHAVPLPGGWEDEFNVRLWLDAYKKKAELRRRIDAIVSKDKKKVR